MPRRPCKSVIQHVDSVSFDVVMILDPSLIKGGNSKSSMVQNKKVELCLEKRGRGGISIRRKITTIPFPAAGCSSLRKHDIPSSMSPF